MALDPKIEEALRKAFEDLKHKTVPNPLDYPHTNPNYKREQEEHKEKKAHFLTAFVDELQKIAALNAHTMLPGSSPGAMKQLSGTLRDVSVLKPLRGVPSDQKALSMISPQAPAAPAAPASGTFARTAPPASTRITPSFSPTSNTIPGPAQAATGRTMQAPAIPGTSAQMAVTVPPQRLMKAASVLSEQAREHISKKNFALTSGQSNTGKPAYPIEDKAHAKAALGLVGMHGSSEQKAEVRKDVAKKYPGLEKDAFVLSEKVRQFAGTVGHHLHDNEDLHEIAGLGTLAVPAVDNVQARVRAGLAGDKGEHGVEKRQLLPEAAHDAMDIGGLGYLAAPLVAKKALGLGHA